MRNRDSTDRIREVFALSRACAPGGIEGSTSCRSSDTYPGPASTSADNGRRQAHDWRQRCDRDDLVSSKGADVGHRCRPRQTGARFSFDQGTGDEATGNCRNGPTANRKPSGGHNRSRRRSGWARVGEQRAGLVPPTEGRAGHNERRCGGPYWCGPGTRVSDFGIPVGGSA